jgi:CheY-like chemotaxis protein
VLIEVECKEQSDSDTNLQVAVVDSGIGIAADKLAYVFGKFTQADASTTRRYGGTGLGLAIAKQLVELMGGEIGVTSVIDQGSTFWFTLRLPLSQETENLAPRANNLAGCHVLVVDDNAVNRRVVEEQVQWWGMRSRVTNSAREALAELRQAQAAGDPYQMAIVDHQMPEMDGMALALAIRSDVLLRDTVLVMLSSMARTASQNLAELEIAACLVKPARAGQLRQALATAWAAANVGLPPRPPSPTPAVRVLPRVTAAAEQPPKHVLVAEDNLVNQKVALKLLESLGCRVDVAANGRQAVEMVTRVPYDIVFMDCQMPEMDGEQATNEIRHQLTHRPRIPIIAMTASAMLGDRERCLAAGMDDYVPKPINKSDLSAALLRWTA